MPQSNLISPQVKTALAVIVPVALAGFYFLVPSVTPQQVTSIIAGIVVIAGAVQGVVNVFHVPSGTKTVLADIVEWAKTVQADVPAPSASLARATKLADGAITTAAAVETKDPS